VRPPAGLADACHALASQRACRAAFGAAGVEACGEATALANNPVRAAPRATHDFGAAWHRCVPEEGWGTCRQAAQGVAGIGAAGVEACGQATALQRTCPRGNGGRGRFLCAIAPVRGSPRAIGRIPYVPTRPPLVVTRLWFGVPVPQLLSVHGPEPTCL
jgi:hypothetical protein